MPNAIAITAHHDDAVLWCGGTILRTRRLFRWDWTVVALCVPNSERQVYFDSYCASIGVVGRRFNFADYQGPAPFSSNTRSGIANEIQGILNGVHFDYVFTHSKDNGGEYGGHANHDEVRLATESVVSPTELIYFCYSPEFGLNGRGTTARRDANYHVQLDYDELIQKAGWCRMAPDSMSSLRDIGWPCPNPEGFRTMRGLNSPFIPHD
jgi:hypothetical protein